MIFIFVIIIFLNLFIYYNLKKISILINIFDYPNEIRKKHTNKVPLLGGIFIYTNILFILILDILFPSILDLNLYVDSFEEKITLFFSSLLLLAIGVYDDKYDLNPNIKLLSLLVLVSITVLTDTSLIIDHLKFKTFDQIELTFISLPFSVLCILLFINAFNMFDGINLQSASYALTIFIYFALVDIFFNFSLIIIISLIFFLAFNYKNNIFLGDSGSILLAYLISLIIIKSYNSSQIQNVEMIFILMMVPGLDMFRLFVQRICNGKNPFIGDRNHLHHLLGDNIGNYSAFICIQFLILIPLFLSIFFNISYIIFLFLIIYLLLIIYLYRFNKETD